MPADALLPLLKSTFGFDAFRGRQAEETGERVFLHRGIAARAFQRSFVLADWVEVEGARLENGLLHIELRRAVPEPQVERIPIRRR